MSQRSLQFALFATVSVCVILAAALAYELWPQHAIASAGDSDPVVASGPAPGSQPAHAAAADAPTASDAKLGKLQLSPQRLQEIGVVSAPVELRNVSSTLQVPGNVALDEQRISYVQTRFPGWIRTVYANATYQYVRKGQRLFTIYSPDLVSTEQEYALAKQNQNTASEHMHGTAANESNWLVQAAEERLRRFDVPGEEIARLEQTGTVQREIVVNSPSSGYITERNALPNAYVQPDTKLYTIADLSTVWVYANVYQNDVGRLRSGDPAQVTVDAYPDRKFNGRIDQILPEVDATTRTVKVRLIFTNPALVLKPGMFVNVNIAEPLGRQMVVPATGVLQAGSRQIAFIDHGQGNLEPRAIETGPRLDDSVVVLKGLKPGDRIVSSANFLVDSEAQLQAAIGQFAPQQQSAAPAKTADQAHLTLTTDPNPPRKGDNTLHLHLADAANHPVDGAQVSVTFFMPAMPAMGMAAMHTTVSLTGKGQGVYQAPIRLDSGGTWNVTVTASKSGSVIATQQLSMNATGGMQ